MNSFPSEPPSPAGDREDRRPSSLQNLYQLLAVLIAGIAIGWTCALGCASKSGLNLSLMGQAVATIQRNYVDQNSLKPTPLTYGAISGMVNSLGDTGHSTFLTPEMVKELGTEERGEFKGIGVEIRLKEGRVIVAAAMEHSPAQRAGIQAGNVIMKVNDDDITGWSLSKVAERITGREGTSVRLTILDTQSGRTRDVTVTRASIKINDVSWAQLPGTELAHLRIASFNRTVGKDLRTALQQIKAAGLKGLVLDLRNDPGGLLDEAVEVASQFLKGGNVLLVKDADGHISPEPAKKGGLATDMPLVVLVNQGSASASEIVAGALRDSRGAQLVGETTFGTGTVLGEFKLTDGSALLLAIQEWLTPKGESFWHKGITPQVQVALPADIEPSLPENERTMTPQQFQSTKDTQLLHATEMMDTKFASKAVAPEH